MTASLSLSERLASLPAPRSRLRSRDPLPAVLGLFAVAVLSEARSLASIAQSARDRRPGFNAALGFTRRRTPCKAALSNLLRRLDLDAFERALAASVADRLGPGGRALRGSAGGAIPGVRLLAAYAPDVGTFPAQLRVDGKTDEHKAALELLAVLPLAVVVVTADAMFTHADFAAGILRGGGDYILPVKDNQPRLRADIALAFETPVGLSPPAAAPPRVRKAARPVVR